MKQVPKTRGAKEIFFILKNVSLTMSLLNLTATVANLVTHNLRELIRNWNQILRWFTENKSIVGKSNSRNWTQDVIQPPYHINEVDALSTNSYAFHAMPSKWFKLVFSTM